MVVLIALTIFEDGDTVRLPKLTPVPRQRRISPSYRAFNVLRGDNQFYSKEKEEQEGESAMMPNSYHMRCRRYTYTYT